MHDIHTHSKYVFEINIDIFKLFRLKPMPYACTGQLSIDHFLLLYCRRDKHRKFTGISSHPSFRANVHFAFANNAETCAEIVTKPGEEGSNQEPRNDISLSQLWSSVR